MKPPPFTLLRARSVDDCLTALADPGADTVKVIAGGQSLMPLLALRMAAPDRLVDISRLTELDYVSESPDTIEIGALVRHSRLLDDPVGRTLPLLPTAARHIGHVAIRNRGTLGGSLSHADPAAELPAVMVLHDAELVCASRARGRHSVGAKDFFQGPYTTALDDDELLVGVRVPRPRPATSYGFVEFAPREGDYARAGAACSIRLDEGRRLAEVRAVLFAVGPSPADVSDAFAPALRQDITRVDWQALADHAVAGLTPRPASADVARRRLARVALRRAFRHAQPIEVRQ